MINPIHQRHANRREKTGCPVFWRRVGISCAIFFACYPAAMIAFVFSTIFILDWSGIKPSQVEPLLALFDFLQTVAISLFLPALIWYIEFFIAACRGLPWKGRKGASLLFWFGCAFLWFCPQIPLIMDVIAKIRK